MPVRNQIEAIVNSLPGQPISFIYGSYDEVNEQADRVPAGQVLVCLYRQQQVELMLEVNGSVSDSVSIHMDFKTQSKFEKNTADNENVVNQMLALCKRFLIAMQSYREQPEIRYFNIPTGTRFVATPIYNTTNSNLTGVSLNVRVKTRQDDVAPC